MTVGESGAGRAFRLALLWIVAAGAALRLVRFVVSKLNQPLLLNDSLYYSAQAHQLAHGVWFREVVGDQPGAEHGPLTSALMAIVSWGNDPVDRQRAITLICGVATVAAIGLVARRIAGDPAGLLAAAVAALYPNLWVNDGLVMSESISCLLVTLTMLVLLRWIEAPRRRHAAWSGALIGLAALARSELLLLAPMAAVLMLIVGRGERGHGRHVIAVLGITLGVIAPWVVFNAVRFEEPVLLTTNEGPLLLGANCPESYYGPALGGWSLFCVIDAHIGEHEEDASVRAAQQRRFGLSYARQHASRWPVVVLARIGRTLDLYQVSNLVHNDVGEERERVVSWAGVVTFWLLTPLALGGARRLPRRHLAVLLMPVAIVLVTTVLFYGAHRIRSSAEPALAVLAAVSMARVPRIRRLVSLAL